MGGFSALLDFEVKRLLSNVVDRFGLIVLWGRVEIFCEFRSLLEVLPLLEMSPLVEKMPLLD